MYLVNIVVDINYPFSFQFNYANGKRENQKFKFSDSKIHLSLIAFF